MNLKRAWLKNLVIPKLHNPREAGEFLNFFHKFRKFVIEDNRSASILTNATAFRAQWVVQFNDNIFG